MDFRFRRLAGVLRGPGLLLRELRCRLTDLAERQKRLYGLVETEIVRRTYEDDDLFVAEGDEVFVRRIVEYLPRVAEARNMSLMARILSDLAGLGAPAVRAVYLSGEPGRRLVEGFLRHGSELAEVVAVVTIEPEGSSGSAPVAEAGV